MLGDHAPADFLVRCRESTQVITHSGRHDSLGDMLQAIAQTL